LAVSHPEGDDELLAEQRDYYERRAPEYDEWWQRRGRYDQGHIEKAAWVDQVGTVQTALSTFDTTGDVLELAGGTGWWTRRLARTAQRLTVVDSSAEALSMNRARADRSDVQYIQADVFAWSSIERFDVVFFSFWLSHVPRARFREFWNLVAALLRPEGRVFLIDNRRDPTITHQDPYVLDHRDDVQIRRLADGSVHRVVEVFYEPTQLEDLLRGEGWQFVLAGTPRFVYGGGHRR
jgi:SAM-dependent methyltransferase